MENLMQEEFDETYAELLKVDPHQKFVRKIMPPKPHARCCQLDKHTKAEIREFMREFAWDGYQSGRIYHDRRTHVWAYSCLSATLEPEYLVKKAEELEKLFPVKVYLLPHVQWTGYRPSSYFKFRATYLP